MDIKAIKLNKKTIIGVTITILLPLIILLCIKLTPNNRNLSKLNKLLAQVEDCNLSLKNAISEQSIDATEAESLLASGIVTLNSIKDDLLNITLTNNKENIKNKTIEIVNYNINLYNITLSILRNSASNDISVKHSDFIKNYELLLSNYDNLFSLGIKSKFPKEAKTFFENSSLYISSVIKLNREKDIIASQRKDYTSTLESCLSSFNSIDEDLRPALEKIREDGRNLDVLLTDIREKKSKLNEIKNKSYSLTIPEEGNTCYEHLEETINSYELYLTSLEHSIAIEKTSSDSTGDENIKENYNNSFLKYSDFIKNLGSLTKEINEFKNK